MAQRTGPVTACVVSGSDLWEQQCLHDEVVFDPLSPEKAEEDTEPAFRVVHTLRPGGFGAGHVVSEACASDAQFDAFCQALEAQGWKVLWLQMAGHVVG